MNAIEIPGKNVKSLFNHYAIKANDIEDLKNKENKNKLKELGITRKTYLFGDKKGFTQFTRTCNNEVEIFLVDQFDNIVEYRKTMTEIYEGSKIDISISKNFVKLYKGDEKYCTNRIAKCGNSKIFSSEETFFYNNCESGLERASRDIKVEFIDGKSSTQKLYSENANGLQIFLQNGYNIKFAPKKFIQKRIVISEDKDSDCNAYVEYGKNELWSDYDKNPNIELYDKAFRAINEEYYLLEKDISLLPQTLSYIFSMNKQIDTEMFAAQFAVEKELLRKQNEKNKNSINNMTYEEKIVYEKDQLGVVNLQNYNEPQGEVEV